VVAPGIAEAARRYVDQIALSLRPSTVAHIEHDLREFSTWLATHDPQVGSCAHLERRHIEHFKAWLATKHGLRTGKPLHRISIKNRLINLHCFFDPITEWGYPALPSARSYSRATCRSWTSRSLGSSMTPPPRSSSGPRGRMQIHWPA
jgi:site-specific recombinase XerD